MTDVVYTQSTAIVTVATPASATVNVTAAGTAVVRQEQATVVSDLQQVQSIQAPNWIQFNTSGTATPGVGRLMWNETDGTLEFQMKGDAVTQQIGMEQVLRVSANDNGGLLKGKVIYATGSDGVNLKVAYATATSETTSSKTLAVMTETVTGGNKGFATTFGLVRGLNTNGMTEGAAVWLSSTGSGNMTTTRPTTPDHAVFIGYCLRANQNNGVVFVNIQNGYELDELHDVDINHTVALNAGDVLVRNGANSLWQNQPQSVLAITQSQVSGLVASLGLKAVLTGSQTFTGTQTVTPDAVGSQALIVKGLSGQTANLQEWQSSSGNILFSIPKDTSTTINSSYAMSINNTLHAFPSYDAIALTVRGSSAQTQDLFRVRNYAGTNLGGFTSTGRLMTGGVVSLGQFTAAIESASTVGAVIRGAASQTANLQEWQNSAGGAAAKVSAGGDFDTTGFYRIGGNGTLGTENSGTSLRMIKATAQSASPGANNACLYFRDGTTAGTLKLVVRAGAAGAETTILDNIPQ